MLDIILNMISKKLHEK